MVVQYYLNINRLSRGRVLINFFYPRPRKHVENRSLGRLPGWEDRPVLHSLLMRGAKTAARDNAVC